MTHLRKLSKALDSRWYYLAYTLLFAVVALVSYAPLALEGRSFVWSTDGATQHLPALVYFSDWVASLFDAAMSGGSVPTWDMSIGMGNDMITSLGFYGIGDVLNLLAAPVPRGMVGVAYTAIAVLRLYLSGIAFSAFARSFKVRGYAVLTAAAVYAFSGFSLFMVLRHPHFIDPLIYLPVVCLGIEWVLRRRRPVLLIVSLWLMFCAHFYLSYMVCVFAVGYFACRVAMLRLGARSVAIALAKCAASAVAAALLAAPLLLPNALAVLDSSRTETGGYVPLVYEGSYYLELLPTLSSIGFAGNQCYIGVTPLGVLAAVFLFAREGRSARVAKVACILLVVSVLVPWVGHAMNGFFYVANRHSFGLVFFACVLIAFLLPEMFSADRRQRRVLVFAAAGYSVLLAIAAVAAVAGGQAEHDFGSAGALLYAGRAALLIAVTAAMALLVARPAAAAAGVGKAAARKALVGGLALVIVLVDGVAMSVVYRDLMMSFDDVAAMVEADPFVAVGGGSGGDDGGKVYRFDSGSLEWGDSFAAKPVTRANSGLVDGRFYDSEYFSLTPWSVSDFLSGEMELGGYAPSGHHYWSIDGRASLLDLLSVRYWAGDTSGAPAGFEPIADGVAENSDAVPFGFTYGSFIADEDYRSMSAVDKQESLMAAGAVADAGKARAAGLEEAAPRRGGFLCASELSAEGSARVVEGPGGIEIEGGAGKGEVTIGFDAVSGVELYVELLDFAPEFGADGNVTVRGKCAGSSAWCRFAPPGSQIHSGYDSGLLFFGYSDSERSQVKLTLPAPYDYSFSGIAVYAVPLEGHVDLARTLSRESLSNVAFSANQMSGNIEVSGPKLLCLSIPYSRGWTAKVDGEEVEVWRVNTFMCGVPLDAGRHEVELAYETPGLKPGLALSAFGAVVAVAFSLACGRKRRPKR